MYKYHMHGHIKIYIIIITWVHCIVDTGHQGWLCEDIKKKKKQQTFTSDTHMTCHFVSAPWQYIFGISNSHGSLQKCIYINEFFSRLLYIYIWSVNWFFRHIWLRSIIFSQRLKSMLSFGLPSRAYRPHREWLSPMDSEMIKTILSSINNDSSGGMSPKYHSPAWAMSNSNRL